METGLVFCIIVTYNGLQWIDKCLTGLQKSSYPVLCIVVDNGSIDGTAQHIANCYPDVLILREHSNLGFGQANNKGIKYALQQKAEYIFLLNQDVYVKPETVSLLIRSMSLNRRIGILSPVHLNGEGTALDDHFYFYLRKADIRNLLYSRISGTKPEDELIITPFVNAAAWMLTSECVMKTGGFDPIFFHYGEDDNYALRARYHGFLMAISTEAFIHHDHDRTKAKQLTDPFELAQKEFLNILNRLCDPLLIHFRSAFYRILTRHALFAGSFALQGKSADYLFHKSICLKLTKTYAKILKSRQTVLAGKAGVFL